MKRINRENCFICGSPLAESRIRNEEYVCSDCELDNSEEIIEDE